MGVLHQNAVGQCRTDLCVVHTDHCRNHSFLHKYDRENAKNRSTLHEPILQKDCMEVNITQIHLRVAILEPLLIESLYQHIENNNSLISNMPIVNQKEQESNYNTNLVNKVNVLNLIS